IRALAPHVDVFMLWGEPLKDTALFMDRVRREAALSGRNPTFSLSTRPILAATEGEAWDQARAILDQVLINRGGAPAPKREWIAPALASPDLVLESQPPAQPHSRIVVERAICFAGGADTEVIGPSAQRAVQHVDKLCGLLPATRSVGQRVDLFDHALDALL